MIIGAFTAAVIFFQTATLGIGVIGGEYEGFHPKHQSEMKTASSHL